LPASTGGVEILYTWVLIASVILCVFWLASQPHPRLAAAHGQGFDLLPVFAAAFAVGLVGARAGYVLTYLDYFRLYPVESLWLWQGGLSGAGAMLGALVGTGAYVRLSHLPLKQISDELAIPAMIITIGSWAGCWLEGSVYGIGLEAEIPLLMTRDMFGEISARWPAALIGLLPAIAALYVLTRGRAQRWKSGCQAALASSAAALGILLASLVRADPLPILFQLRLDTLAGLLLSVAGVSALLICYRGAR
jgi:prolipoprotein diacylglyceryltransferase